VTDTTDKQPTFGQPGVVPEAAGSAGPAAAPPFERPEVQAGAAFAGGLVAALILKRLGN
jgi:hypothetical protein